MIQFDKPMPKTCNECELNYDFCYCIAMSNEEWEKHEDDWNSNILDRGDRPDYCPLKEQEPTEPELEGGGSSWWYVCGECHGMIDDRDAYCRHCGRRIKRNE